MGGGAVNQTNPFYNYYQYLPFRSKTNYSADSINSYTNSNVGGSNSKLLGTGSYFYNVQDLYGINGALQYAMGIHESGWGKSTLSLNKNNLFGMNATDDNPYGNGTSFPNVESGINYHADRYISWGYTDPIDDYRYYGSHVGNKGSGMNVKYASDPFWGEKIAGWYYRFDQASGMKDYNYYSIGIKQSNVIVNVRSRASNNSSVLYQTKNKKNNQQIRNYPVLINGLKDGYYTIKSDTPIVNGVAKFNGKYEWRLTDSYISKDAIDVVNHHNYKTISGIKGWQCIDSGCQYYDQNSQPVKGWQWIDGYWYYFNESGHISQWWKWIDGIHYYFNGNGQMVTGWQVIDGNHYYFNQSGHSMTGWQEINGIQFYFDELGKMAIGWNFIDNHWYYFNHLGRNLTGWQWIDGIKYYFNHTGKMITGWQWIDGYWYYFNESGHISQWWKWIDGIHYYFNGNGQMLTDWQVIDGKVYYFNQSGHSITGWKFIGGNWYYFNTLAQRVSGWQNIDGIVYYFNNIGQMLTGIHYIDGHQHYFNESGHMIY